MSARRDPLPRTAAPLDGIDAIVEDEIAAGRIPGAVVVVGRDGAVVYRRAFGRRTASPVRPMTLDTIFDLASLTKVMATTPAVLQLVEQGRIGIDEPAATYWPEFAANGKRSITIRHLLTHYSGLRPDLSTRPDWRGYPAGLRRIVAERPVAPPGRSFLYSDTNFAALGEIVRRVSGEPLDVYCARHVFQPLGLHDTGFRPAEIGRLAPTVYAEGSPRFGSVHDPIADRMGGVAGHAGLFSTADDVARFAQTMLDGGSAGAVRVLRPSTLAQATSPENPDGGFVHRGLGWDLDSPLAADWSGVFAPGVYGHTGYTGTSLWIDPTSRLYVVILTNRVHLPDGDARPLRARIAALVAHTFATRPGAVTETGIDVLEAERFAPLVGRRVGLVTNASARDAGAQRTVDVLHAAPGVELAALFSPEHGLDAAAEGRIQSGRDARLDIPIYSLYGPETRPTPAMLDGLDALVFDVPDVGTRFYTYVTTMAYAMEAAARKGIPFYVLDRPNPLTASIVQGPTLDPDARSFTGYFPIPIRYGMTIGELAGLFNVENGIGADLHVITMRGYRRDAWYDDTGLQWVPPSPNLRSLRQATLYPGVALVEGANVSIGRGTAAPFELLGAPWIDGRGLARYLNGRAIDGVRFEPIDFQPTSEPFRGVRCHGIRIVLLDRNRLDAPALGIEIASALHRLHPRAFRLDDTRPLIAARWVVDAVAEGRDPRWIVDRWRGSLDRFRAVRDKYLRY
ncbi:MAG TPA: serine hydrolase [Candidatus Eisenbacteria bacterium]|nr:serine hydrolase [Candidatus Eisenbacteria bacterium]